MHFVPDKVRVGCDGARQAVSRPPLAPWKAGAAICVGSRGPARPAASARVDTPARPNPVRWPAVDRGALTVLSLWFSKNAVQGETPGLRAGVVEFFELDLPARWKQVQVANILSGNYCQPRCGEPWVEVEFDGPEGHVQVWVSPQDKLTNGAQPGLRIDEIGNTRGIITSLGPYVTGNTLDPDDEVMDESVVQRDGQTYFQYEIFSPYAKPGQEHGFVSVAARGECVCWLAVTASDDKWDKSFNTLQKIGESFVA